MLYGWAEQLKKLLHESCALPAPLQNTGNDGLKISNDVFISNFCIIPRRMLFYWALRGQQSSKRDCQLNLKKISEIFL